MLLHCCSFVPKCDPTDRHTLTSDIPSHMGIKLLLKDILEENFVHMWNMNLLVEPNAYAHHRVFPIQSNIKHAQRHPEMWKYNKSSRTCATRSVALTITWSTYGSLIMCRWKSFVSTLFATTYKTCTKRMFIPENQFQAMLSQSHIISRSLGRTDSNLISSGSAEESN